jgi:hypothetical protein
VMAAVSPFGPEPMTKASMELQPALLFEDAAEGGSVE